LQGRLERAENTLQAHSKQLQDAVITSRTDGLTGLTNRRALDEELRRCLVELQGQGRPAALLMVDVDHFKRFNDTHGHVAGDQALVHVAEMLRSQARASDIVARFGGEEFAVVFTAATASTVRERAERLRLAIAGKQIICDGREVSITASAGLADASSDDAVADWIKRADAALYAAKKGGRNCTYLSLDGSATPLRISANDQAEDNHAEPPQARSVQEAAAELAAEAFADTSFVQSVAKRIAEWKRGGATLTVILAQVDQPDDDGDDDQTEGPRPVRLALQWARGCVREMDLVTRWQRRGLAILLPCTSAADAKTVARRLCGALAQHGTSHKDEQALSLSVGIAEGIEGNDAKRVLERAWLALQASRATGSSGISVHDGVKTVNVKRIAPVKSAN
jgi:diguanylate cyclase (GGDEF)-like protein